MSASLASKSTIRIDTFKLDELFDSVGELVIAQNFIAQNEKIRSIEDESINRTICGINWRIARARWLSTALTIEPSSPKVRWYSTISKNGS